MDLFGTSAFGTYSWNWVSKIHVSKFNFMIYFSNMSRVCFDIVTRVYFELAVNYTLIYYNN